MPKRAIFERKKGFLEEKSKMIRKETLRLTDICGSGHYGSAFSIVELLVILYYILVIFLVNIMCFNNNSL